MKKNITIIIASILLVLMSVTGVFAYPSYHRRYHYSHYRYYDRGYYYDNVGRDILVGMGVVAGIGLINNIFAPKPEVVYVPTPVQPPIVVQPTQPPIIIQQPTTIVVGPEYSGNTQYVPPTKYINTKYGLVPIEVYELYMKGRN